MHKCNCGLTFESEQAYSIHKVFCKWGVYLIVAVFAFLLFADVIAALAQPAGQQVYLPLIVEGPMVAIGDSPAEPTATRTPIPVDWRTPRAEWSNTHEN